MGIAFTARLGRREFLTGAGALVASTICIDGIAQEVAKEIASLKPGEFHMAS